ncbi:thioredoxin family protein [Wenyingzhuangia sp. IMCC45533]
MPAFSKTLKNALETSFTYEEYLDQMKDLSMKRKSSGNVQSEELTNFTKLNHARMKRLTKTQKVNEDIVNTLLSLETELTFLILTESWCGDAAQTVPVLYKIAKASNHINLRIAYRDENSELMNHFLTNGNQAIPKLIILDNKKKVIADWGPRPTTATKMVNNFKEEHGGLTAEFKENLQLWYNQNKGLDTLNDVNNILLKTNKPQTI